MYYRFTHGDPDGYYACARMYGSWHEYGVGVDITILNANLDFEKYGLYRFSPIGDPVHVDLLSTKGRAPSIDGPGYAASIYKSGPV